jgi:hypothetical protein
MNGPTCPLILELTRLMKSREPETSTGELWRRPGPALPQAWWKPPTCRPQEGHRSMRNPTVIPRPAPGRSCEGGLPPQRRYNGTVDVHPGAEQDKEDREEDIRENEMKSRGQSQKRTKKFELFRAKARLDCVLNTPNVRQRHF